MSDVELKPCPFCGHHARIFISDGSFPRFIVRCGNSVCPKQSTVESNSLEGAIALWNCRPIEDALKAENARFREALEFYAKEIIYQVYSDGIPTEVEQDGGAFARQVLKGTEDK